MPWLFSNVLNGGEAVAYICTVCECELVNANAVARHVCRDPNQFFFVRCRPTGEGDTPRQPFVFYAIEIYERDEQCFSRLFKEREIRQAIRELDKALRDTIGWGECESSK